MTEIQEKQMHVKSLGQNRLTLMGANFHSKTFQGPKLHITVHFILQELFVGDGSKSTLAFKIFKTLPVA